MTSREQVSLQMLRRYHFNELSPEQRAELEARLESEPEARARLDKMRAEEAAFLANVDLASESVAILEKLDRPQPGWFARVSSFRLLKLAIACSLLFALVPVGRAYLFQETGNRLKGSVQLEMFVKDEAGVRKGDDGMRLQQGDQIQFRYRAVGHRYLFVVSVDTAGSVSPLYPEGKSESIAIVPDGLHTLEGSIILDDAVGPERIFAVFSDDPIPYAAIERALAARDHSDLSRLRELELRGEDVDQASILIIKE